MQLIFKGLGFILHDKRIVISLKTRFDGANR